MAKEIQNNSDNQVPSILIIEPFYGGSHKQLIDTLMKRLPPSTLVTMKAKKWHWRARCASLCLNSIIPTVTSEKVLFCSSVLNLAELLGVRSDLQPLKKVVYFHENQFVYPVQEIKCRDIQYCYNELMTCLAADVILFNSHYNMNSLLNGISKVMKLLPDYRPKNIKNLIESKSKFLYFPMEYPPCQPNQQFDGPLHILWPHRWEFDKNPDEFFDVLYSLKNNGLKFNVSILGESFSELPSIFEKAKEILHEEIKHFGFVQNKSDYYDVIRSCHVVVSTAKHEFFGVALLEAAYCGCSVLAPNRLVYPEIYPASCLYDSPNELYVLLEKYCSNPNLLSTQTSKCTKKLYDWSKAINISLNNTNYVCSKHFNKKFIREHYLPGSDALFRRVLTPDAIPNLKFRTLSSDIPSVLNNVNDKMASTSGTSNDALPYKNYVATAQLCENGQNVKSHSGNGSELLHGAPTLNTTSEKNSFLDAPPILNKVKQYKSKAKKIESHSSNGRELLHEAPTLNTTPETNSLFLDTPPILDNVEQYKNKPHEIESHTENSQSQPEPSTSSFTEIQDLHRSPIPESSQKALPLNFVSSFSFDCLKNEILLNNLIEKLPFGWGIHHQSNSIIISHMKSTAEINNLIIIDKALIITDLETKVLLNNNVWRIFKNQEKIILLDDLILLIRELENIKVCCGSGIRNQFSKRCTGENLRKKTKQCFPCSLLRKQLLNISRNKKKSKLKHIMLNKKTQNKFQRLKQKQEKHAITIKNLQKQMATLKNVDAVISGLPENQKLVIKTCIDTASQALHGKRYSKDWIYACMLIKIKSPKLYRHLRTRNLLPLPSPSTLSRYIKNIDSSYGFQNKLFEMIKEKTKFMTEYERHGTLMVDECKITASKHFDKNRLAVMGFVDLGKYTPIKQKDELGDHALVMFQPFAGKHMQALACFLSKGSVTGDVQAKLILEAVLLCEASGLFIDVVTSDGATWNRAMWKAFGAGDPQQPWCVHPCNDKRTLRMCSDFPHLIKCVRNRLVSKSALHVPEGYVRLDHFKMLVEYDAKNEFKLAPKLTQKHIRPEHHEKMTTKYAYQLFSGTVTILKDKNVPGFSDCEPTIQFCRRVNQLCDIFNSNNAFNAIRPNSSGQQALENFLIYLDLWESSAEPDFFLTRSTAEGLRASINTALNLLEYCCSTLGFKYLMLSRIDQDPLEHFFSLLRLSGGANNNAESVQIAQIFRLLSLYSLVKPPRGSNVTGGNMLEALVCDPKDVLSCSENSNSSLTKTECDLYLDKMLEGEGECSTYKFNDNEEAFAYLCGYIARKFKSEQCSECMETIIGDGVEAFNVFISLRSRGHLIFPAKDLILLLQEIEVTIIDELKLTIKRNTLLNILEKLAKKKINNLVGCAEHKMYITKKVIFSYLVTRMSLTCQKEARKRNSENSMAKKYAKLSKIV